MSGATPNCSEEESDLRLQSSCRLYTHTHKQAGEKSGLLLKQNRTHLNGGTV